MKQSRLLSKKMEELNLTPKELSDILEVKPQYLSSVLSGRVLRKNAGEKWAKKLNIPLEDFLEEEDLVMNLDTSDMDERKENPDYVKMINRLMLIQNNMSQIDFSHKIGIKATNYSGILNYKRTLGDSTISKIAESCGINSKWLKYGTEPMYLLNKYKPDNMDVGIPYYDVEITNMKILEIEKLESPSYHVDFKPFNDCTSFVRWSGGSSMEPEISNGDAVVLKRVINLDFLPVGESYLIITNNTYNNLKIIRKVHLHSSLDSLILRAVNAEYSGDMIIKKDAIVSMYLIKGIIKYKGM